MTNNQYKKLFPIFKKNPDLHYLDSAATALKPKVVLDKMMEYYTEYSANIHRGLYQISERATEEYEKARKKVADFIGAEFDSEVVFAGGTTDSINLIASGWGENNLEEGDEMMVLESEHHSNLVPWQELAKSKNLEIRYIDVIARSEATKQSRRDHHDPAGLVMTDLGVTEKTKLLAIAHVSNVLGKVNPIKEIVKKAREINPDICVVVDGAQAVAHIPVDVVDLDVDFYVFSGHKLYGPTGVGVVYGKAKRWQKMSPVRFGGGMIKEVATEKSTWASGPEKFEAGTPPIAEVIGLGAAVDFVKKIGFDEIKKHENELTKYLLEKLQEIDWIGVLNEKYADNRLGLVAMYPKMSDLGTSHDIADVLGRDYNVCVRAGHHCAMPLHQKLDLLTGTVRASLGIYNDMEDVDMLIRGLKKVKEIFGQLPV